MNFKRKKQRFSTSSDIFRIQKIAQGTYYNNSGKQNLNFFKSFYILFYNLIKKPQILFIFFLFIKSRSFSQI